jgi:putative aldouronate transport system permease protein
MSDIINSPDADKPRVKYGFDVKYRMRKYRFLYIFLAIIVVYYLIFNYYPILLGVVMSLKTVKIGMNPFNAPWANANGKSIFDNYISVVTNPEILNVIKNTLQISLLRLVWTFWPPIVLAIGIFDIIFQRFKKICQTIIYVPYFFSWVIVYGIVFAFFSGQGFMNSLTAVLFNSKPVSYLEGAAYFRSLLIGSQIWKGAGWGTILYFAGLTTINPELYEAAKIDGAGPLQRIRAVTLPGLLPLITFNLIFTIGGILGTDFEQILMYYNAAVYSVADVIDTWVYRIGLGKMQYSVGSAVGLMRAFIAFILIILANKLSHKVAGRGLW